MKARGIIRVAAAAAVIAALLFAWQAGAEQKRCDLMQKSGEAEVGKDAPWFAAHTPGNAVINTTILFKDPTINKLVYVYFATHCVACRFGLNLVKQYKPQLDNAGVRVVLVDYMEEAPEVKTYLDKMGLSGFVVALDKFGQNAKKFGLEKKTKNDTSVSLPRTFVIGKDKKVIKIIGAEGDDYISQLIY